MKTLTEQYGIKVLEVGQLVLEEDFGWGIIEEIHPCARRKWHAPEFMAGMIQLRLDDGTRISTVASMVHLPHSLPDWADNE